MQAILVVLGGLVVGYFIGRLFAAPRGERHVQVQLPPMDHTLPPAGESARKAAESLREFGTLVERLAARDVAVNEVVCEPGTRWHLVVERGADADRYRNSSWETGKTPERRFVTRVSWIAGAGELGVTKSIQLPGLAPNQWQDEPGKLVGPEADAIRVAEAFIMERLARDAGPDR